MGAKLSRKQLEMFPVSASFTHPLGGAPPVSNVRSTLLTASLLAIREQGWEARYYAKLPKEMHDEIRSLVAGNWIPLRLALAHYEALDQIGLTASDIIRAAEGVSHRTQKSFAATIARASTEVGATPWLIFSKTPSIWERIFAGGDVVVYRAGPKEAYVEVIHCPLLRIPYFRQAIVSYFRMFVLLLSKTVYADENPSLGSESSIVFRCSWV